MRKIFNWFIAIFLTLHGSIFLSVGITYLKTDNVNFATYMILLTGLTTLVIGICLVILNIKKMSKVKELKLSGIELAGEVVDIQKTKFYVNHRPLFRLVVKDINGNIYYSDEKFKKLIKRYKIGDKVKILVMPDNPKIYLVLLD